LPSVFNEDFSLPTQVLRHKRSKYAKSLVNKDIQGDSRSISEPAATDYIKAIEEIYLQLEELIEGKQPSSASFPSEEWLKKDYEQRQKQTQKLTDKELAKKLSKLNGNVSRQPTISNTYTRNEYVAEFVRRRAAGICELCENQAPFKDTEGEPFLEEHHIKWLSKGGLDTPDNAVALCPNCHRKMHVLGLKKDEEKLGLAAGKTR